MPWILHICFKGYWPKFNFGLLRFFPPHLGSSQGKVTCSMADAAPIVGGEDEKSVVEVPAPLQGVHHLPDGLVHGGQHPQHQHPLLAHFLAFQAFYILSGNLTRCTLYSCGDWKGDDLHWSMQGLEREIKEKWFPVFQLLSLLDDPHCLVSIEMSAVPGRRK